MPDELERPPVGSVAAMCQSMTNVELAQYLNSRAIDITLTQASVNAALQEANQSQMSQDSVTVPRAYFLSCIFFGITQHEGKHIFEG